MFNRIDHVVIAVTDLDAAANLYGKNFGLKASAPQDAPDLGGRRIRFDVGNAFVDVVQPSVPGSPLEGFIKERGEGIYLIGVQVDNLKQSISELRRKGVQIIEEGGRVLIHPKSTHGALMLLTEKPDGKPA